MEMIDPALDFLEFIILLAGVCSICFILIIPITKEIREVAYETNYDKTVSQVKGEKPLITENGCQSALEISLSVASQNTYLVSPKTSAGIENQILKEAEEEHLIGLSDSEKKVQLKIGTEMINLSGNAQYDTSLASQIYSKIQNWCVHNGLDVNTTVFKIMFNMGEKTTAADNYYQLYYLSGNELIPCS